MLIDCTQLRFELNHKIWTYIIYKDSYLNCIDTCNTNKIYLTYCAASSLLIMRNVDVIYLQNLHKLENKAEFKLLQNELNEELRLYRYD